jgi:AcrR family transcriptional regulator
MGTVVAERPLRADARRNRDKVLHAARDAFATSGFDVPVDEIAARAGVGAGTLYRHFPTKEALFEAVIATRIADLVADAEHRANVDEPGTAFFGFLDRLAEEAAVKRDMPDAIGVSTSSVNDLHAAFDALLRGAQKAGAVRGDIATDDILALFKSLFTTLKDAPSDQRFLAMYERLFTVITDGLRPPHDG